MSNSPRATLHLKVLGQHCQVPVDVPPTPAEVADILPAARAITNTTMDIAFAASDAAGKPATCRRGCASCCQHLVAVSPPEARNIARLVAAMPAEKQAAIRDRFARIVDMLHAMRIMEPGSPPESPVWILSGNKKGPDRYLDVAKRYFRLHLQCAFLEDGACSIYDHRPMVCREHAVTSPVEHCEKLEEAFMKMVDPPVKLSDALAEIASLVEQKPPQQIPLFGALAWAALPENAAPKNITGPDLLKLLARWIDSKSNIPLENRPRQPSV